MGKEFILKGEYVGYYPKWNEETQESYDVFKYALTGSAEAIAEYKRLTQEKGYNVNEHADGRVLFFTLDFSGNFAEVKITTGGAIVINDEALKQLQSLTKKTSGVLQEKLAEQGVAMLLGNIFKSKSSGASSSTIERASEETPEASAEEASPEEAELGGEE